MIDGMSSELRSELVRLLLGAEPASSPAAPVATAPAPSPATGKRRGRPPAKKPDAPKPPADGESKNLVNEIRDLQEKLSQRDKEIERLKDGARETKVQLQVAHDKITILSQQVDLLAQVNAFNKAHIDECTRNIGHASMPMDEHEP